MLQVTDLSKSLGGAKLLDRVSLTIERGKATALLGGNGSGKSVTGRAISLLDPPDEGTWRISSSGALDPDKEPVAIDYTFPRREPLLAGTWPMVTMVFQGLHLWPHLTLAENIELAAGAVGASLDEGTMEMVDALGMTDVLRLRPNQCSGGQRQKGAVLRAYAQRRSIRYLVADEITAALDMDATEVVGDLLHELKTKYSVGLLLISHQLGLIGRLADRVAYIERGRIVEQGDRDVMTHPTHPGLRRYVNLLGWRA